LKHHHRAFLRAVRGKGFWSALAFIYCLLLITPTQAQSLNGYDIQAVEGGLLVKFRDVDYVFSLNETPPASGWERGSVPQVYRASVLKLPRGVDRAIWGRYRFDRSALSDGKMAVYALDSRCQLIFYINGREVFRNFADPRIQKLSWYKPFLIPVPDNLLRPGMNEITIRAASDESIAVGRLVIGPHIALEKQYLWTHFWRVVAPQNASNAMLVVGCFAFMIWAIRRSERSLLYLMIMAVFCYARNFQYFGEQIPFNQSLFNAMTVYSNYFGGFFGLWFYLKFINYAHRRAIIAFFGALAFPLCFAHWYFGLSDLAVYLPTVGVGFMMAVICMMNLKRSQGPGEVGLSIVVLLVPLLSLHDIYLFSSSPSWDATNAFLVVFNGFLYCVAFLASFVKRSLDAFAEVGASNFTLARRIAETRAELAASEAARQELIVSQALAGERERLMQEMHDGIGSNLITALAVARQQKQPSSTIKTLSRALGDLKLTVDSLEPIEGDLVALIGNLRHRMAGDLKDAGIICKWEAEPCGTLPWLDAANALHVLRIFQEAIGNVLTHSGATEMRIGCREVDHQGARGLSAYVADNGVGFNLEAKGSGKGLSTSQSRARSIHGHLDYASKLGEGTVVTLFLPYQR
jgi:signal transduction histidine kinase